MARRLMSDTLNDKLDLPSKERLRKKKLLSRVCFAFAVIIAVYLSAVSIILPGFSFAKLLGIIAVCLLIVSGIASQLERTYRASAWAIVTITILVGTGASLTNGGLEGYVSPILVTAPVAAALFLGPISALVSAGAVVCALAGLLYLDTVGLVQHPPYAHEDIRMAAFILLSTTVLICAAGMTIFAGHSDTLISQLVHSQKQLQDSEQIANQQRTIAEERRDEAEQAIQDKDRFLSNISHEIRTPLNGIVGVVGVLENSDLTPNQAEMVDLVKGSSQSLQRIIEDILCMAKLNHESFDLQESEMNLASEARTAASPFETLAAEKGLVFNVNVSEDTDALFLGDSVRIRQIISNLVSNAVKFTDRGHVTIDVSTTAATEHPMTKIVVEDTGAGFRPDIAATLFERFEQASQENSNFSSGTGLGLAIVKELAERMGGTVGATSTPGLGSTFTVEFPLPRVTTETATSSNEVDAGEAPNQAARRYKILCAEDHPVNKKVISLILSPAQFEVTHVNDGSEAVTAFQNRKFDLILMDMQMPNMNGIEATREIRSIENQHDLPATPIVMLSANAFDTHVENAFKAGCSIHIPKPFTPQSLVDGIAQALNDEVAPASNPENAA